MIAQAYTLTLTTLCVFSRERKKNGKIQFVDCVYYVEIRNRSSQAMFVMLSVCTEPVNKRHNKTASNKNTCIPTHGRNTSAKQSPKQVLQYNCIAPATSLIKTINNLLINENQDNRHSVAQTFKAQSNSSFSSSTQLNNLKEQPIRQV